MRRMGTYRRGQVVLALALFAAPASAQVSERQVRAGLALLPADARAGATIEVAEGDGFIVRRAGDNGWLCRIGTAGDRLSAECHQQVLEGKLALERELGGQGLSGSAVRARLADAIRVGRVTIPAGSVQITGSGPLAAGSDVPAELRGYYFVQFPFATPRTLGLPGEDPGSGHPWLHHGGTADAHIMWAISIRTDASR